MGMVEVSFFWEERGRSKHPSCTINFHLESGFQLRMTLKERSKVKSDIANGFPICDFLYVVNVFGSCRSDTLEDKSRGKADSGIVWVKTGDGLGWV